MTAKLGHSVDKKSKFSRKRHNEDEGDITYINERNRVFNKKVSYPGASFTRVLNTFVLDCAVLRQIHDRNP